ncbi:MAG: InlB B-repeat-containing protein [Clostridia bacterium]|nr:InlB B-repeat-containing protein [Clostridia bacterium]
MSFGERLKNLRKQADLTQSAFAEKAGVHFQTVSKWERGASAPDISVLGLIAETLGVTLETLLGVKESETPMVGAFDLSALATAIADYRKGAGWSQSELAEKMGTTSDTVSKWERGVTSPDIDALIKLSELFSISPSVLYYGVAKEDETERTVYYRKKSAKKWWLALAFMAVAAGSVAVGLFLNPTKTPQAEKTYAVTLEGANADGVIDYTVGENDWFAPPMPEKTGYTFIGYENADGEAVSFPCKITEDTTLYAKFSAVEYAVDYWLNGGRLSGEIATVITVESAPILLPVPQKDNETFEGWYVTPDYSGEAVTEIACEAQDVTVYAKWSKVSYTVRYFLNGGACKENPTTVYSDVALALNEPTKSGYRFLGWYNSPDGGERYTAVGGSTAKNLVLYALWQKVDTMYEIIYHLDGGILETENPTSLAVGESVRLFEPTKQGHVFLGWNDQANGGGAYYEWLTGEKSIALYAIYAPKEYTIRYEYEGVYESEANPSFVTFGEEIALHSVIWEGYTFVGWYTSKNGGEKVEKIDATNVENIQILYAIYTPKKYSVQLDGAGGAFEMEMESRLQYTVDYVYDTAVVLPACARDKYTFIGWKGADGAVYTQIDKRNYMQSPFTATYYLTNGTEMIYVLDGGEAVGNNPANAFSGQNVPLYEAEKDGYLFLGWNTAADGTGVYYESTPDTDKESFTLYAIWQEIIVNGSVSNFRYVKGATEVKITEYIGEKGEHVNVVIPSYIDGLPVKVLGEELFFEYDGLQFQSITLPQVLREIQEMAFQGIYVSKPLVIPKTVTTIGPYAFSSGLFKGYELRFEENSEMKVIGAKAFQYANFSNVVTLPEGVEEIGESAFHASSLKGFILPSTLRKIGKNAFRAMSGSFKESDEYTIYLPSTVTEIGFEALYDCTKIYTNMSQEKMATFSIAVKNMNAVVYVDQPSFTVTLNYGDKAETRTGAVLDLPVLEKENARFIGWKNAQGEYVPEYYIPTENGTLTATFAAHADQDGRDVQHAIVLAEQTTYEFIFTNNYGVWFTVADPTKTYYIRIKDVLQPSRNIYLGFSLTDGTEWTDWTNLYGSDDPKCMSPNKTPFKIWQMDYSWQYPVRRFQIIVEAIADE